MKNIEVNKKSLIKSDAKLKKLNNACSNWSMIDQDQGMAVGDESLRLMYISPFWPFSAV